MPPLSKDAVAPQVTVVIPTFGRAALLARAVASVFAQTVSTFELIVVVDGQDPETCNYLSAVNDARLSWIVNHTRTGPAVASQAHPPLLFNTVRRRNRRQYSDCAGGQPR